MARRTRRDLSNKKVRRIIHKELNQTKQSPKYPSPKFSVKILKPILYGIALAVILFGIYYGAKSLDFPLVAENQQSVEKPTGKPERTSQPSGEKSAVSPESQTEEQESQPVVNPVQQKPQIEVLNGCGVDGIALQTTKFLRKNEFDVVYMGNYEHFNVEESKILDRIGNRENSAQLAKILGIDKEQIEEKIDRSKQLDASLILGKDYQKLIPFKEK